MLLFWFYYLCSCAYPFLDICLMDLRMLQTGGYVYENESRGWSKRKEARIRDKWMKVRIRYSGKNLAIIHSLVTLYNISYS